MDEKSLFKFTYGMYIVASQKNNKISGQISNVVMQLTADEPKVAVCINKENFTHSCIKTSNVITINILSEEAPLKFIGIFGFRHGNVYEKFKNVNYRLSERNVPIISDYTVSFVECEIIQGVDVGSHTLFIGKVVDMDILNGNAHPMSYEYYHKIKGGKTAKNAPTYSENKD